MASIVQQALLPYVHPFPEDQWTTGRVDQGQDFAPKKNGAAILSPGNAKVIKLGAPGWPGGAQGVLLQLLDGDRKGQYVYIYESLSPTVGAGATVRAGQKIAEGRTGGTGIEIGWADKTGAALSRVHGTAGQKDTPAGTPEGRNMKSWLAGLSSTVDTGDPVSNTVNAAADAASSLPGKIVSALFDAIGADGARILLYIGFVLGGTALALGGISVMMGGGVADPIKFAAKAPKPVPVPV